MEAPAPVAETPAPAPVPAAATQPAPAGQPKPQPARPAPQAKRPAAQPQKKKAPAASAQRSRPVKQKRSMGKLAVALLLIAALIVGAGGGLFAARYFPKKGDDSQSDATQTDQQEIRLTSMEQATALAMDCLQALKDRDASKLDGKWVSDEFYYTMANDKFNLEQVKERTIQYNKDKQALPFAYLNGETIEVHELDGNVTKYIFPAETNVDFTDLRIVQYESLDAAPDNAVKAQFITLSTGTMGEVTIKLVKETDASDWSVYSIDIVDDLTPYIEPQTEPVTDENGNPVETQPAPSAEAQGTTAAATVGTTAAVTAGATAPATEDAATTETGAPVTESAAPSTETSLPSPTDNEPQLETEPSSTQISNQ